MNGLVTKKSARKEVYLLLYSFLFCRSLKSPTKPVCQLSTCLSLPCNCAHGPPSHFPTKWVTSLETQTTKQNIKIPHEIHVIVDFLLSRRLILPHFLFCQEYMGSNQFISTMPCVTLAPFFCLDSPVDPYKIQTGCRLFFFVSFALMCVQRIISKEVGRREVRHIEKRNKHSDTM